MKFLKKYYSQIITCLLGGLTGFFIAVTWKLHFEEKVNPIAVASLILTIIIALYLEFSVRPSISNTRTEKDLLIDQLKEIKVLVSGIQELYHQVHSTIIAIDNKKLILTKFRMLSNSIQGLKDIIEYSGAKPNGSNCQGLLSTYIKYKQALTGDKFGNSNFQYDKKNFSKHGKAYQDLNSCIQHFIIDVNKLS